ncbi:uncharacterized protein LOC132717338 [Ruditapes philippinarum]|uniref:uncharacterized protein LOC132717338 n=1 Tax=Ruditapes philippinarum TaxID=129788 RepID=UPI00295AD43C|nr:uncharacterized protein LOC132717338 [Ruditapes philippinarum]
MQYKCTVKMNLLFIVIWCLLGLMPDNVEMSCYNPPSELCTNDMVEIPSLETRDPSVMITNKTSHWTFCDVYAIDTNIWYKSEISMTTQCPSMYMCGAKFPIWMNGENPSPGDGLVNRTSCLRDFDTCCLRTYRVTAVNCEWFMAYCFVDLPSGCHQRYCFDNNFTSTSTPLPTSKFTDENNGNSPSNTMAPRSSITTTAQKGTEGSQTQTQSNNVELSCYNPPSELCNNDMVEIPSLETRDPSVMITNKTSHWTFCDVYAIDTNIWYKSKIPMTTQCPSIYMCGAKFPIWMNGENPSPGDGLVNRTSCLRDFDTCCLRTYRVTAVNCEGFMAYCFVDLPSGCHQRYCFDNNFTSTSNPLTTSRSIDKNNGNSPSNTMAPRSSITTTALKGTEGSQTQTPSVTQSVSSDGKVLTVAFVVIGLTTATIIGLLIYIIRRKRLMKVIDKDYDTLKYPTVKTIKVDDAGHLYSYSSS